MTTRVYALEYVTDVKELRQKGIAARQVTTNSTHFC